MARFRRRHRRHGFKKRRFASAVKQKAYRLIHRGAKILTRYVSPKRAGIRL